MINEDALTFPRAVAWGLDQLVAHEDSAGRVSIGMGLVGLGVLLLLFASATAIVMVNINQVAPTGPLNHLVESSAIQSVYLPPLISCTFVVSAVFFWYVPIWLRFLVAVLLVVPASLSFVTLMAYMEPQVGPSFLRAFFSLIFAAFIGAGTVALTIQMWSPWTLCHLRDETVAFPSLGTRALFELTAITAISFAIIIALSNDSELTSNEFIIALMPFAAFGAFFSLAGIGLFFAFLRRNRDHYRVGLIAAPLAFAAATLLPGFHTITKFGWGGLLNDLPVFVAASTFGTIVFSVVAGIHLWWLRICGWRCVDRRRDV